MLWAFTVAASLLLLLIAALGEAGLAYALDRPGGVTEKMNDSRSTERSLTEFAARLPAVDAVGEEGYLDALCRRLPQRFFHGSAGFTLWSNYAFCVMSPLIRQLRQVENSKHLFRYCRGALCHQIAQAMVDLATGAGIRARVVGLDGHVVVEAYYNGAWHGFDPDYGVVFRDGGRVLSISEAASRPGAAERIYRGHRLPRSNEEVLHILARNRLAPVEPGRHLSPGTARFQLVAHGFKWWIPLAGITVGTWQLMS